MIHFSILKVYSHFTRNIQIEKINICKRRLSVINVQMKSNKITRVAELKALNPHLERGEGRGGGKKKKKKLPVLLKRRQADEMLKYITSVWLSCLQTHPSSTYPSCLLTKP